MGLSPAAPAAGPVVVVHATARLGGGTLLYLQALAHQLDARDVAQLLVHAPTTFGEVGLLRMFGPRVARVVLPPARLRPGFLWAMARALREAVEAVRASPAPPARIVVHLHGVTAGVVGRLAMLGQPPGVKLFYSAHGPAWLDRRRRLRRALLWLVERAAGLLPAQPVACGPAEARRLELATGRPAVVLEPPVAACFVRVQRAPASPPLVVSVGRICEQKGTEHFAALAMRFQIAESPVRFVWVGDGDERRAAQLAGAGVTVTGWVDREDVAAWLARATVFVQTSHWEALPLALLEALTAGVPCVATDEPAHREVIRPGVNGLLAARPEHLAGHVHALLRDPAAALRYAAEGRRMALARFTPRAFETRLAAIYGLEPPASASPAGAPRHPLPPRLTGPDPQPGPSPAAQPAAQAAATRVPTLSG